MKTEKTTTKQNNRAHRPWPFYQALEDEPSYLRAFRNTIGDGKTPSLNPQIQKLALLLQKGTFCLYKDRGTYAYRDEDKGTTLPVLWGDFNIWQL